MARSTRRALAAVGILTGGLLVGVLAGMAMASNSGDAAVIEHIPDEDPQDVLDYWTPERIRDAEPAPMPTVN